MGLFSTLSLLSLFSSRSVRAVGDPDVLQKSPEFVVASFGPNLRMVGNALDWGFEWATSNAAMHIVRLVGGNNNATDLDSVVKTVSMRPLPSPSDPGYLLPDCTMEIMATNTGWRLLLVRLHWVLCRQSLLPLIRRFSPNSILAPVPTLSATYASWLFEAMAHDRLCEGGDLVFRRLKADPLNPALWTINASSMEATLNFEAREQEVYALSDPMAETSTPQTYYIPAATNNPTFDAFIFPSSTGQSAIAFQMTLAASHTLKKSGLSLLAQRLESARDKQFIFVVPKGRSFSLADPTNGVDAHELSSKMSFWVLEIPLSPDCTSSAFVWFARMTALQTTTSYGTCKGLGMRMFPCSASRWRTR